jgi:hypothetical protein
MESMLPKTLNVGQPCRTAFPKTGFRSPARFVALDLGSATH